MGYMLSASMEGHKSHQQGAGSEMVTGNTATYFKVLKKEEGPFV